MTEKKTDRNNRQKVQIEVIGKGELKKANENRKKKQILYAIWILFAAAIIALTSARVEQGIIEYKTQEVVYDEVPTTIEEKWNDTRFIEKTVPYSRKSCDEPKLMPYRYDYRMDVDSLIIGEERAVICVANVTNLEDRAGNFTFYAAITRNDGVATNYLDQRKEIAAKSTESFVWTTRMPKDVNGFCSLRSEKIDLYPRCEVEPIGIYHTITVNETVEKLRNVTVMKKVPRTIEVVKEKQGDVYINRLFGYRQPVYLGY